MRAIRLALLLAFLPAAVFAHSAKSGSIYIGHVWAKSMDGMPEGLGIFFPLLNKGEDPDALVDIKTPSTTRIILCEHKNDIVRSANGHVGPAQHVMCRQRGNIDLPPNKPVSFKEKDTFLMIVKTDKVYKNGDRFPIILYFAKAAPVTIDVMVEDHASD